MDKIWLQHYPPGVPHEVELDGLSSIGEYWRDIVQTYPERTAFVSGSTGVTLRYAQADALSRRVAGWFRHGLKLPAGSRVALMMPNVLQFPVCLFGLLRAGYVVVNVNPMYTPRELQVQLQDSGATAVVVAEPFAATVEQALEGTDVRTVVVSRLTDCLPALQRWLGDFLIRRVRRLIPPYRLPKAIPLRTLLQAQWDVEPDAVVQPDDLAFLQYTGGTTGVSKGAMLTHRNILANAQQGLQWSRPFLDPQEVPVNITAIPLYHIFALGNCLGFAALGGTNVLVADPRNTTAFVRVLRRYPFTSLPAVNTLFNDLTRHPDFPKVDFRRLRLAIGGGAAVQAPVAERWQAITGAPLIEGYGLTECSPVVSANRFDQQRHNGSIGLPLPSTEVSLRDAQGDEVPLGTPGELCVRGPQVMKGYWQRPEETARVMTADGFLRTGDLAVMDETGQLRIVDRIKDLILVSGFNVYPNEIEEVAVMLPDVLEAAAVGRADAASGERVVLFVVPRSAQLTAQAVHDHCRSRLTRYKWPAEVHLVHELPKTNVGKILRRSLRERAAALAGES